MRKKIDIFCNIAVVLQKAYTREQAITTTTMNVMQEIQDQGMLLVAEVTMPTVTTVPTAPSTEKVTSMFDAGTEPHKDWICPISFKLMKVPVVAEDGYSYEKTEIETWLQKNATSPMNRSAITNKKLYKNTALAVAIQAWKKNNPNFERKDEELDRRIELSAMRVKPSTAVQPTARPQYQDYYIRQGATLTFPGWNVVHNVLNSVTSPSTSPRPQPFMRMSSGSRIAVGGGD